MFLTASVILAAIIVWSLVSGRMTRWYVTAPIALILLGMAAGWETCLLYTSDAADDQSTV